MKTLILVLFGLTLSLVTTAQDTPKKVEASKPKKVKKPKSPVKFETYVIERKGITNGADETFSFHFKNTGKTPLIVTNVATSCGCTTAQKPEEPIMPGKKGVISVKYDTKRVGEFTKEIKVTTNASETPVVLLIKGSVNPAGSAQ